MGGVIACRRRREKKIQVARFLFEILHPPRRPERLQLFFWKFGHVSQYLKRLLSQDAMQNCCSRGSRPRPGREFDPSPDSFEAGCTRQIEVQHVTCEI